MKQSFNGSNYNQFNETEKNINEKEFSKKYDYIDSCEQNENNEITKSEISTIPPFINFVTFNRMGLTIKNFK